VGYRADVGVVILLGAVAEQGGDVADFVKLGVVFDVEQFDVAADDPGENGLAYVDDLTSFAAADGTEADQVGVEVAAAGALDGLGAIVLSDQQGLHFA